MFKDELLVYFEAFDPSERGKVIPVQLLVDKSEVKNLSGKPLRNRPASGWLQVMLAHEHGGVAEVVLPQPAQPVGESALVDANDLKEVLAHDPVR